MGSQKAVLSSTSTANLETPALGIEDAYLTRVQQAAVLRSIAAGETCGSVAAAALKARRAALSVASVVLDCPAQQRSSAVAITSCSVVACWWPVRVISTGDKADSFAGSQASVPSGVYLSRSSSGVGPH